MKSREIQTLPYATGKQFFSINKCLNENSLNNIKKILISPPTQ